MAEYRAVCFTLNNPSDPIPFDVEKMEYLVYQREVGVNGTPHFQGYCEFKTKKRLAAVKELLGNRCHIERRFGTQEQAIRYAKKEDTRVAGPWEFGEPKVCLSAHQIPNETI